jgi:hypothetical protein
MMAPFNDFESPTESESKLANFSDKQRHSGRTTRILLHEAFRTLPQDSSF